jgi:DNA-binding NtrC family response regulator
MPVRGNQETASLINFFHRCKNHVFHISQVIPCFTIFTEQRLMRTEAGIMEPNDSRSVKTRILFADKNRESCNLFQKILIGEHIHIETSHNIATTLKILESSPLEIVIISDITDQETLLNKIQYRHPGVSTVTVFESDSQEKAVKTMGMETSDYSILKPFDFYSISSLINKIRDHRNVLEKKNYSGRDRRKNYRFENFVGQHPAMLDVFQKIRDVAVTNSSVLITGETGTGKELVAEAIHYRSLRRSRNLIRVNCAALTKNLINSELFGHEKGAFSGAETKKSGYFEHADNGTVFLDEIGDIPIPTQIALLRVFDSGSFQRVGGTSTLKVDVRLICATNKNLSLAVEQKIFREDFFHRINVVPISIPPLRERKSDIILLADHFLNICNTKTGKNISGFSDSAKKLLLQYNWPGNIRELTNVIERAVVFCKKNKITPHILPASICKQSGSKPFALTLTSPSLPEAESALIKKVLEESDWNLKQAAEKLNIARGTLYSKINKFGLNKHGPGDRF